MAVPGSLEDLKSRSLYVALAAEFLGTFFLVLIGCGSCHNYQGNTIGISLAFGLAVGTMAWCIGHISGCHINTAVTFGFLVTRKISILRAALYMIVQVLGAIVGALVLSYLLPLDANNVSISPTLCTSQPADRVSAGQTFGIELLITFILIFTVFATCDGQRGDLSGSGALSIGLSLTLVHLFAVPLTGSGMNPARVFGPALISGTWNIHWAYWTGPLTGGALAAILYDTIFAVNASPSKLKGCCSCSYDDSDHTPDQPANTTEDTVEAPTDYKTF